LCPRNVARNVDLLCPRNVADDNPDRQTPDNPHGVDPEAPPDWADPVVTWEELDP